MSHRFINWAIALAVLCVMAAVQQLDARDFESDLVKERRAWMHAIQHCHRAWGPSTQPEYDERGRLVCVSRRGEVLATVQEGKP